ncbi:DUF1289 domain-containing protein [Pseudomonas sp.]|uniref:DUF1289 domain-containing protein n=1 Tax=Pseudomonas sp. TaxID=306 RepID=UPI003564FC35
MNCWGKCSPASPWSNLEPALSSKSSEPRSGAEPERVAPLLASPCVRRCCLDECDICLGCGRSLNEILDWGSADTARRQAICQAAQARLSQRRG